MSTFKAYAYNPMNDRYEWQSFDPAVLAARLATAALQQLYGFGQRIGSEMLLERTCLTGFVPVERDAIAQAWGELVGTARRKHGDQRARLRSSGDAGLAGDHRGYSRTLGPNLEGRMISLTPAERAMVRAKLSRWSASPKAPNWRREALRTLTILQSRAA